ncbi:MAG: toprim domain-containing protein [Ferruginibacter sp.]
MNIDQAKAIAISEILKKLDQHPQKTMGFCQLYYSPFRNEKTPSLWVNHKTNTWRDFGDVKWGGGDIIHLVRAWLDSENENCEVKDALRWLSNMTGFIPDIKPVYDPAETETEKTLVLRSATEISNFALIQYSESRGIPLTVLKRYFQQAAIYNTNTGKVFYALSMKNDLKGYELRTPYFKGCLGKKYISFIRGTQPKPPGINIFEGAFDFATAITLREGKPFEDDTLILHSLSNLKKATAYIKKYGYDYAYTWMDNDDAGKQATQSWAEFCKNEPGLKHIPKNIDYLPYKDLNASHIAKLEL